MDFQFKKIKKNQYNLSFGIDNVLEYDNLIERFLNSCHFSIDKYYIEKVDELETVTIIHKHFFSCIFLPQTFSHSRLYRMTDNEKIIFHFENIEERPDFISKDLHSVTTNGKIICDTATKIVYFSINLQLMLEIDVPELVEIVLKMVLQETVKYLQKNLTAL